MATVMEMPKLSDTMTEGSVARWLKKEGEKVSAGLPIIEIDTDKATMEYESPVNGILLKILVEDGEKCALQAPIAVIGKADEKWKEILEKHKAQKTSASVVQQAPPKDSSLEAPSKSSSQNFTSSVVKASPLAKKIAADKGIDLKSIQGSGPQGRIVQRDLSILPAAFALKSQEKSAVTTIPHTNMRKTIARRLLESVQTAPHFFLTLSVSMGPLLSWRKEILTKLPEQEKFSVNDLIIFLTARALKKHPALNASWQEEEIVQYGDVHLSVAVALPHGLVTPVVRNADQLHVVKIAQETKRLVKLAKEGKLQPSDYTGGTFSLSNLGMAGIENFTAIINPPQAAILAVGSTLPTPVVLPNGSVGVEQRMKMTLSCDHRVIDGAVGAEFLKTLKQFFEDPFSVLFLG
jgi:pyruvate dehydrogenase E2 component (dihydrolipoamide acetyltransferase)